MTQPHVVWEDHPNQVRHANKPDLWRCKTGAFPPVIALDARHKGGDLHWWCGRSFPHIEPNCPACAAKCSSVWKGYIGAWNPHTRAIGMLEFTFRCLSALDAYFLAKGTCRGAMLKLKRSGSKETGRLSLTVTDGPYDQNQLPEAIDTTRQLLLMWGAKRLDEYIDVEPTRPVVEPPSTTAEVIAARQARESETNENHDDELMKLYDLTPTKNNGCNFEPSLIEIAHTSEDPQNDRLSLKQAGEALAAGFRRHNPNGWTTSTTPR